MLTPVIFSFIEAYTTCVNAEVTNSPPHDIFVAIHALVVANHACGRSEILAPFQRILARSQAVA